VSLVWKFSKIYCLTCNNNMRLEMLVVVFVRGSYQIVIMRIAVFVRILRSCVRLTDEISCFMITGGCPKISVIIKPQKASYPSNGWPLNLSIFADLAILVMSGCLVSSIQAY